MARARAVRLREEAADRTDYRSLIELATVGVTRTDTGSGRIHYANDAFCRMVGYSHEELSDGKLSFVELTHPDDRARNIALHKQFMAGHLPHYAVEKRYVCKDGSHVWARTIVTRMKSDRADVDETFTVILDITHEILGRTWELSSSGADVRSESTQKKQPRLGLDAVERYILDNWHQAITVDRLSKIANLPKRSLHTWFKRLHGTSPMNYVKRVRLEKARALLVNPRRNDTVSSIALRCAFTNLGHFAKDYKRAYGELPSETIAGPGRPKEPSRATARS